MLTGCQSPIARPGAKFCCVAHQRANAAQKGRAERAVITRSRIVYCGHCHELIQYPKKNQKHHAECASMLAGERSAQRRNRINSKIQAVEKVCICGRKFKVKITNKQKKYCTNSECSRERARLIRLNDRSTGKAVQKRELARQVQEETFPFQDRDCQCPGCGTIHTVRFEPAYIGRERLPRKYCTRYPACLRSYQSCGYHTLHRESYSGVFESENGARI
jgi:hypothetical protein